jgi:small subunit ribosomal protein S19e
MSVFDVPAGDLIDAIAEDMEKKFKIKQPEFTLFVKTGCSRERAPQQKNWYYMRLASLLYRVFKEGPVGVGSLRTYYGSKKNRGVRRHKFKKAGGKIIRTGLQQLEELGFIRKDKKGRVITPKGQSYLTKKANELRKKLLSEGKLRIALPAEEKPKAQAKDKKAEEKKPEKETKKEAKKETKSAKPKRGRKA